MQTVIRGASQLKVTRSRRTPGSSAGTGDRRTSSLPAQAVQPPYHLFRRGIEAGLLPYAAAHHIGVLACGPPARGLLGGTITEATTFGPGDWRSHSPASPSSSRSPPSGSGAPTWPAPRPRRAPRPGTKPAPRWQRPGNPAGPGPAADDLRGVTDVSSSPDAPEPDRRPEPGRPR